MERIDKSATLEQGMAIGREFLLHCFNSEENRFVPSLRDNKTLFSSYKTEKYNEIASRWLSLLRTEQNGRCCYCMRRLPEKFNVEHIIPQSLKGNEGREEFKKYTASSKLLAENAEYAPDYADGTDSPQKVKDSVSLPHTIAHVNLVAACNGLRNSNLEACCCNNERGKLFISPFVVEDNLPVPVSYNSFGIIETTAKAPGRKEEIDPGLKKIIEHLNGETYQQIRLVWHKIAVNTALSADEVRLMKGIDRILLFRKAFSPDKFENLSDEIKRFAGQTPVNDKTSLETYWRLLLDFDWFLGYYRN